MSNSGAKAALRGYRLQTLFILNEILNAKDSILTFQPEGNEDLAVYKGGKLVRVVQIKAHSEPLTLSTFVNSKKKDSFFHRVAKLLDDDDTIGVELISFGEIGTEILKAWAGDEASCKKIKIKLNNFGIDNKGVDYLFKHLLWQTSFESDLNKKIIGCLNKTLTAGSPENALSLLTSWLYVASEHKTKITPSLLMEKISAIGKYLAEREAYHDEWYTAIKPLIEMEPIDTKNLEKEYYTGISTRFSHIMADLDIERTEQLKRIDDLFKTNQTVIIHGASGQGKTSLAYRYLHDYIPEDWRLQIHFVKDRNHAKNIALAIADHLAVFNSTLYLYIDVSPRDLDWTTVVKSVLDRSNIKILISIREEDLARQNISNEELGLPAFIPLRFSKQEAEHIYLNLVGKNVAKPYPSFKQAWLRFGGEGSLLEYIYFLTQTESLKEKLAFQVKRLRSEVREGRLEPQAIKLLLACAVATSYEARVKINLLIHQVKVNDPQGIFDLFDDEYLIRRSKDSLYAESLHPIRSRLLVNTLVDPAFLPWIDSALCVIPCLVEADIETFLLYSFIENTSEFKPIFDLLTELELKTWTAIAGTAKALLWYGIHSHILENDSTIKLARENFGNGEWSLLLYSDIGEVMDNNPVTNLIEMLGNNNPSAAKNVLALRDQVSSSVVVFQFIKKWLAGLHGEFEKPKTNSDWSRMGETLLWLGRLKINTELNVLWLLKLDVDVTFTNIEPLADLLIGLYYFDKSLYQEFIQKNKNKIERIFQHSTKTLWLEYQPENPIAHYIIPLNNNTDDAPSNGSLNEISVIRIKLLRKLFPDQEKYGAKGYGHKNVVIELPIDESDKPHVIKSAIPIPQFVSVNSTWANYGDYVHRPNDWQEYAKNIIAVREQIVDGLVCLNKTLISYFKKRRSQALIEEGKIESSYWEKLSLINRQITKLPKLAVDPWGITSEGTIGNPNDESNKNINYTAIQAHSKNYRNYLSNYINSITNFFNQSYIILIVNGLIGRLPKEQHQVIIQKAKELGLPYTDHNLHLATLNFNDAHNHLEKFQQEFTMHFQEIIPLSLLNKLDKKEKDKFNKAWPLWYQFAYHPENYWKDSPDIRASTILDRNRNELIKSIENSLDKTLPNNLTGWILSKSYLYEGEKSLWIAIEIDELSSLDNLLNNTISVLCSAIRPINFKDLKYFVIANQWENIVIVPMHKGVSLSGMAWVILANSFVGEQPVIDESKPILYIPRPIDKQAIEYFGFKVSNSYVDLIDLEAEVSEIFTIINHINCFNELPNINVTGEKILQQYLASVFNKLIKHIELAETLVFEHRVNVQNTDKDEFLNVLDIIENAIQPYEAPEDKQLQINLEDCFEWAELLNNATTEIQLFKWQNMFK